MRTDVIEISSAGDRIGEALNQAEKVAQYKKLSPRGALHLRLLTEEMTGLMRSVTGETDGRFWIEDENGTCELHLQVDTRMNLAKREQLLSVSSTGKNESAKGLMGRIRDLFDVLNDEDVAGLANPLLFDMNDQSSTPLLDWEWSMTAYRDRLAGPVEQRDETALAAWDELEKSVVAHVADDVKVSIHGGRAELMIIKNLA